MLKGYVYPSTMEGKEKFLVVSPRFFLDILKLKF